MTLSSSKFAIALLAVFTFSGNAALASVTYNLNGWNSGDFPGASGFVPGTWVGGPAPAYTGTLNTVWYADLSAGTTEIVSSAGGVAAGADPLYQLVVGPQGWQRSPAASFPNQGMGHGADIGLLKLETAADLTITVDADSLTPNDAATVINPGFSLFRGWDIGTTANQVQAYYHNQDDPLGTVGLTYLNGAGTTGTSISLVFSNLAAGNYSLILGGNGGGGHGDYKVTFASPIPLPATLWLFGSVLASFGVLGRRKAA